MDAERALSAAWSKIVPLKVSTFFWRLWKNRIPTRDDLMKRGILVVSQMLCPFDCEVEESVTHIFFECPIASRICCEILGWLDFAHVSHNSTMHNFFSFYLFRY